MVMKSVFIYIVLCFIARASIAQVYVAPSPDALGLAKFANIPVNYYTGSAAISIPLAQAGGKEIIVPISLHYNASGHKVSEMAGSTGLGWSLQAGGVITRITRSLPDDLPNGFCKPSPSDKEPDLFFYSFLGQSGKFILDKFGNAITTPYRDIIIKPGICAPGSNGTWEIIDENGFIYKFGTDILSRETTTVTDNSGTKNFVSTWFLTEIRSPNNTETMQFSYSTSIINTTSYLFKKTKDPCRNNVVEDLTATISINTRHIHSITGPLGTVNFTYASGRKDVPGSVYLTSMQVNTPQFQQVQKYRFEYGYFQSDGCASSDCFRLRLDKIFDLAPDPLFSFTYNTSVNLPSRYSKNFDHWGYYNDNTVNSWFPEIKSSELIFVFWNPPLSLNFSGASREPDAVRMSANILTSVLERGGGSKQFNYEPHLCNHNGTNRIIGGARIKSISTSDGQGNNYVQTFSYFSESNPALSSGLLYIMPKYLIGQPDGGSINSLYQIFSHPIYDIFDLNGVIIGYSYVEELISNGGKSAYYFTNFSSNPNYVDPSTKRETDLHWERGNIYKVLVFDHQDNLISEQIIDYNFNAPNKNTLSYDHVIGWSWSCQTGWLSWESGSAGMTKKHKIVSRPFFVSKQTTKFFDPVNPAKYTSQVTEYSYDPVTLQLTQTVQYDASRPSNKYITKTRYVTHNDYLGSYDNCYADLEDCNLTCQNEPDPQVQGYCYTDCNTQYNNCISSPPSNLDAKSLAIYYLRNRHQVATPIETISLYQEGSSIKVLASSLNTFEMGGASGNHILLKESWGLKQIIDESSYNYSKVLSNGNFQLDSRMKKLQTFDLYDQTSGNLLQQTALDGIVKTYNWEPNNKYIQSITTNPGDNARTTSYTYKPLVGVTSITDPNGLSSYYDYDVFNRLKIVKDQDQNIIKRYRYHYQNETPAFRITANRLEAMANETFTFYATDVAASTGGNPRFVWDFGSGVVNDNNVTTVNHAYAAPGQYTVKLVALHPEYGPVTRTLPVGVYAPMSLDICVDGPAYIDMCGIEPVYYGGCTVNNTNPWSPTEVSVSVMNGCPSTYSYYWEYQNYSYGYWTSLGTSPTANFYPPPVEGTYEIRCTVTDGCYNVQSISVYIFVYKSNPQCEGGIQH
jgi:hypothetical protein